MVDTAEKKLDAVKLSARGFSLLEIAIVVLIVGVVATIAVPRYANALARYRIDAAARRIVADIEYARQRSRSSSTSTKVHFMVVPDIVHLIGVPGQDDPSVDYETKLREAPYHVAIDSVDFGGDNKIIFDGYGVPDSGGFVQIIVGTEVRKVSVDVNSGEVTIQ